MSVNCIVVQGAGNLTGCVKALRIYPSQSVGGFILAILILCQQYDSVLLHPNMTNTCVVLPGSKEPVSINLRWNRQEEIKDRFYLCPGWCTCECIWATSRHMGDSSSCVAKTSTPARVTTHKSWNPLHSWQAMVSPSLLATFYCLRDFKESPQWALSLSGASWNLWASSVFQEPVGLLLPSMVECFPGEETQHVSCLLGT